MQLEPRTNTTGYIAFLLFCLTVPLANYMIENIGTTCIPDGPCLIPVGFGLEAPSGVLMVGAALVLRDFVHEKLGALWAIAAIIIGAALSALFAAPALVMASAAAFLLSEAADFAVYAPLRRRQLTLAVLSSGLIGAAVDSAVFLYLAFGSLAFIEGQIIGKVWMSVFAALVLLILRARKAV